MGAHRELCLVDMCGEPWDSLVGVQCLAGCILAKRWGASLVAGWRYGTWRVVVQSCKVLMTAVALSSLQLGSHDLPQGRGAMRSWRWVAPLVGAMCCTAMLEPWVAAAAGLGSSY